MPRRKRPGRGRRGRGLGEPAGGDLSRIFDVGVRSESYLGRTWRVRDLRGSGSGRRYVCPGCQQSFAASIAHVVVWPDDGLGDVSDRRHWHTACWRARDRRPPRGSWR